MSWFPGTADDRRAEAAQEGGGAVVLVAPAAVRQVAARDDQLGLRPRSTSAPIACSRTRVVARPEMEIGDVQDARNHRRSRLYSE